jgi:hypothetical protein
MFRIDKKDGQVFVTNNEGKSTVFEFENYINAATVVAHFTDIYLSKEPSKRITQLKEAGNILGCIPSKFAKMLRGAVYQTYVIPYKEWIFRFALQHMHKTIDATRLYLVIQHSKTLRQYEADGNKHLQAFALMFGDAKCAKLALGQGVWRALCKNSRSRNDLLFNKTYSLAKSWGKQHDREFLTNIITELNTLPTTFLKTRERDLPLIMPPKGKAFSIFATLRKAFPDITYKTMIKENKAYDAIRIIVDTLIMAQGQERAFDKTWSLSRWHNEHNALELETTKKAYPSKPYPSMEKLPLEIKEGRFTARLLNNAYDLFVEGQRQHHCVASYAYYVEQGLYAVYSITDGAEVSTLGIPAQNSHLNFQHYSACNSAIVDIDRKEFGNTLHMKMVRFLKVVRPIKDVLEEEFGGVPQPPNPNNCIRIDL